MFISAILIRFLPETLPWLLANGKRTRSFRTIAMLSKVNRVSSVKLESFVDGWEVQGVGSNEKKEKRDSILALLQYPFLRGRAIIGFLQWGVVGTIYYSCLYLSVTWAGDVFLNNALSCLADVPAYLVAGVLIKYTNRRKCILIVFILTALCCFASFILTEFNISANYVFLLVSIRLITKFFIQTAWLLCIIHHSEMFPTSIRASGLAFVASGARILCIIIPFVVYLHNRYGEIASSLPFGILLIIAGLLNVLLPETANEPLISRVQEMSEYVAWKDRVRTVVDEV